jgi:hypothetical protein
MISSLTTTQRSVCQQAAEPLETFVPGPFEPIISHHHQPNKNSKIRRSQGQYYNPWEEKSLTSLERKRRSTLFHFDETQKNGKNNNNKSNNNNRPTTRRTLLGAWLAKLMNSIHGRRRRLEDQKTVP